MFLHVGRSLANDKLGLGLRDPGRVFAALRQFVASALAIGARAAAAFAADADELHGLRLLQEFGVIVLPEVRILEAVLRGGRVVDGRELDLFFFQVVDYATPT